MTKKAASLFNLTPWRIWQTSLDHVWQSIFGSPDLGAVEFKTLVRRQNPNDALICPRYVCSASKPDSEPPIFPFPASRLRALISDVALSEPDTSLLHSDAEQDRYLVRTKLMRYPDTVVAQVIALDEEHATLALYSRSQIGRSDFGVNRKRLQRWLSRVIERAEHEKA
jgi:uncharacterized protein (DUF1499 family)